MAVYEGLISLQNWSFYSKLVKKILDLEFVDWSLILGWHLARSRNVVITPVPPKGASVTNILLWVECYAALVAILASKYPQKTKDFMMYLHTIMKTHRSFVGDGWITYDTAYRRKAAATKSLNLSQVDFTLYNETFTGREKSVVRCYHCSSDLHSLQECPYAPTGSSIFSASTSSGTLRHSRLSVSVCGNFNSSTGNQCRFNTCKFVHVCAECHSPHSQSECHQRDHPPSKVFCHRGPRIKSDCIMWFSRVHVIFICDFLFVNSAFGMTTHLLAGVAYTL